jgi:hypothetical protein
MHVVDVVFAVDGREVMLLLSADAFLSLHQNACLNAHFLPEVVVEIKKLLLLAVTFLDSKRTRIRAILADSVQLRCNLVELLLIQCQNVANLLQRECPERGIEGNADLFGKVG